MSADVLVNGDDPRLLRNDRHDNDDDCNPQGQPGNLPTIVGGSTENDIQEEGWFKNSWRPAAAWFYLFICAWDFFFAPIALAAYAAYLHVPYIAWVPLTLGGGAIFHLSFGAIVGIYAYSRTRERLAGIGGNPTIPNTQNQPN